MNRETIEKAADIEMLSYYADEVYPSDIKDIQSDFIEAFSKGARWRINSAWHDFEDEIPEKKRPVLIESKSGGNNVFLLMVLQGDEEREDVASYRRWAYIEDLIPDMTEEAGKEDAL